MAEAPSKTAKTPFLAILFIVSLTTSLATIVRLLEVAFTDFPFNDGGMFTVMTQDLINNHFAIPMFTSYNLMNIPYAYSPLMFYVTAILSTVGHWSILDLIRVLPSLVSIAIVPAQYMLAYTILKSHLHATFAAFAYALSPASFVWLISGGGLTRAPGILFAVLAIHQAYLMYTSSVWRPGRVLLTALFTALGALSHPQIAWDIGCTLIFYSSAAYDALGSNYCGRFPSRTPYTVWSNLANAEITSR